MRNTILFFFILCIVFAACNAKMKEEKGELPADSQKNAKLENPEEPRADHWLKKSREGILFTATGNEPFWSVDIDGSGTITYRTPENMDGSTFAAAEPVQGRDGESISYEAEQDSRPFKMVLLQSKCTDSMSGLESPYQVEITIGTGSNIESLRGCGRYIGDYRLHDIWTLTEMAGQPIAEDQFPRGVPTLELQLGANAAMGNAGCNQFRGSITFVQEAIAFGPLVATKMACPAMQMETRYLGILSDGTLAYQLENGRLKLGTGDRSLIFRKVD